MMFASLILPFFPFTAFTTPSFVVFFVALTLTCPFSIFSLIMPTFNGECFPVMLVLTSSHGSVRVRLLNLEGKLNPKRPEAFFGKIEQICQPFK